MVTVHVLTGATGKRYVGITNAQRLREHRARATNVARLLGDFRLPQAEEYDDHSEGREREQCLKSGQGREWLDDQFGSSGLASGA